MVVTKAERINLLVQRSTHDDLKVLGNAGETYNDVSKRLIAEKQSLIDSIRKTRAELLTVDDNSIEHKLRVKAKR